LAERPEAYGRWWHFAGSGVTTQRELANQVFAAVGRKPKLRVAGKSMLRVLGLFNPLMRELVEMNYLQTNPVILDDSALRALLGPVQATSYADGIRRTLEAMRAEPHARAAA
jgi:nucleoside-diphosphate-sugar epimerase